MIGAAVVAGVLAWNGWMPTWGTDQTQQPAAATETAAPAQPAAGEQTAEQMEAAFVANPLQIQDFDVVLGSFSAPVTVFEYASMTCSHCKHFHDDVFGKLKAEWIDTGKVKFVMRDMPWDNLAVGMTKITRCGNPANRYPLISAFFASQDAIIGAADPLPEIKKVAAQTGMTGEQVEACIRDEKIHGVVMLQKMVAQRDMKIQGTPTLFVNGRRLDGAPEYDVLKKMLDEAYAVATGAAPATGAGTPIGQ